MQLVYKGPHDGAKVVLANGASVIVPREGSADFAPEIAESLLAQGGEHWRQKPANGKKKEG